MSKSNFNTLVISGYIVLLWFIVVNWERVEFQQGPGSIYSAQMTGSVRGSVGTPGPPNRLHQPELFIISSFVLLSS